MRVKRLGKYGLVGVLNTAIHAAVFFVLTHETKLNQALSNAAAFAIAVSVGFVANATWTFATKTTAPRYIAYVLFMGALALTTGWIGDQRSFHPAVTLIAFATVSYIVGFLYSSKVVFKERHE